MQAIAPPLPPITVCLPVYNGAGFVEKTLRDIQQQTFTNILVFVSVDLSQDDSVAVCQTFETDARFKVFAQSERLGWVQNTNFLLDQVQTEYLFIMHHDDRLDLNFLQRLYDDLQQFPEAAGVYPDVQCFGLQNHVMIQEPSTGEKLDRVLQFLSAQFNVCAMRGLMRRSVIGESLRLKGNPYKGFGTSTVWTLQMICRGTLHRLPEKLYFCLLDPATEHHKWKSWEREWAIAAWVEHCADCAKVVLAENFAPEERHLLLFACLNRTLRMAREMWPFFEINDLPLVEQSMLVSLWISRVWSGDTTPPTLPFALYAQPSAQPVLAEFYARDAKNQVERGDAVTAETQVRRALAIDSTIAEFHETLAAALDQQGRLEEAIAAQATATTLAPQRAYAWNRLGNLYAKNNQPGLAEPSYRTALTLENDGYFYDGLSRVLAAQGQIEAAFEAVQSALALMPDKPHTWAHLGSLCMQQGQLEAAEVAFDKAIALGPTLAYIHSNRGQLLARRGDSEQAIAAEKTAVALDPMLSYAWGHLGHLYLQTQQWESALPCYQKAIALDASQPYYHHGLSLVLSYAGEMEGAIAAEKIAIDLLPSEPYFWQQLETLHRQLNQRTEAEFCQKKAAELSNRHPMG